MFYKQYSVIYIFSILTPILSNIKYITSPIQNNTSFRKMYVKDLINFMSHIVHDNENTMKLLTV